MNTPFRTAFALAACLIAAPALARVTFYEHDNYQGRSFSTESGVSNFMDIGFNDRASSIVVASRSWEVCDNSNFGGRCVVLSPGNYASLQSVGLSDRVSSVRLVAMAPRADDGRYQPAPPTQPLPPTVWQRRGDERLFEAKVVSARAVVGTPERRCWIEREEVPQERSGANVPGAVVGALLGGIIGHQIGGGTGRDIATATGVVGGAVVGSRVGRDNRQATTRDVERCNTAPRQSTPDYWDVSYRFRGKDHRVQMTHAPGDTITVNRHGEPRE